MKITGGWKMEIEDDISVFWSEILRTVSLKEVERLNFRWTFQTESLEKWILQFHNFFIKKKEENTAKNNQTKGSEESQK